MHMRASLNGRDHRNAYIGYVFENLNAFAVNLAPNARIGDNAKRWKIDTRNELATCARQDYDLIASILSDPVEGVDKLCMVLCCERERAAFGVKFSHQYTSGISREL
jgi:hypothetical protein